MIVPGEEKFGIVELSLSEGSLENDVPVSSQELLVGGTPASPILFHQMTPTIVPIQCSGSSRSTLAPQVSPRGVSASRWSLIHGR